MSRSKPVIIYRRIQLNQYIFSSWIDRANRSSLPWSSHASMMTSSTAFQEARESFFFFGLNQWRWVKNDRCEKSNMTLWLPAVFGGQALHMFVSLQTITGKFMTDQRARNNWHTHQLSLEIMTLFVIVIVITIVVVDDTYFGDVGEGSEWFIAHSIIHVIEFGWFRASLRRSLLRIDGLSSSRSSFVTDGLFAGTALLSSFSPSLRMKMYRMMAQRPSSPLKIMKNHTRTLPDDASLSSDVLRTFARLGRSPSVENHTSRDEDNDDDVQGEEETDGNGEKVVDHAAGESTHLLRSDLCDHVRGIGIETSSQGDKENRDEKWNGEHHQESFLRWRRKQANEILIVQITRARLDTEHQNQEEIRGECQRILLR